MTDVWADVDSATLSCRLLHYVVIVWSTMRCLCYNVVCCIILSHSPDCIWTNGGSSSGSSQRYVCNCVLHICMLALDRIFAQRLAWTNKGIYLKACVCEALWSPSLTSIFFLSGSNPSRTAGFLGTSSPGPMADLYAAANQDSGVSSYISAASPAPNTGFGHGLGVGHACYIKNMQDCTYILTKGAFILASVSLGSSDCNCIY